MQDCCSACGVEIKENCEFATVKKVVDGKELVFCCIHCYEDFEKKKKE